jgi:Tfp pilus assembly protein PilV
MTQMRQRMPPGPEAGFMMIEVLVSAIVLLIASAGVFGLLQATSHSTSEDRHRSEGYAVSQEDQARLRSMRLSSLNGLSQTRTVTLNGTKFTVHSTGTFINDQTAITSCGTPETSTADYVKISSEVTWPRMQHEKPAVIESIISPSKVFSLDPSHGTLTVSAKNAQGGPLPELTLAGTGVAGTVGTFNGVTNETGCAMFADLLAGKYNLQPSGTNLVDKDGKPPAVLPEVSVVPRGTNTLSLQYDHPGTIGVSFETLSEGKLVPAKADSLFVFNTGMTTARIFSTLNAVRESVVNATPLYPFPSPYSVYAGSCASNNPNPEGKVGAPGAAGVANVAVVPGGTTTAKVQLPALDLTVKNGATAIKGAKVTITDKECKEAKGNLVKRTFTTNEKGKQTATPAVAPEAAEPGLPWGEYEVCASAKIVSSFRFKKATVTVKSLTTPAVATIDLSSGTGSGECP